MSLTLILWLVMFAALALLAFWRPSWGVALYMLTFFACPPFWWWGDSIAHYRWNFYGGVILLLSVCASRFGSPTGILRGTLQKKVCWTAALILVNASFVHLLLASRPDVSVGPYILLAKFILLFFMIVASIHDRRDFQVIVMAIVVGAAYIGYEVTINDRGSVSGSRLEGIGAPGATGANELASLMVAVLPLTGALFLCGNKWQKCLMLASAPFVANVLLLCNSRGAFLASIVTGIVFLAIVPRQQRKPVVKLLALGVVAVWLLLGDPQIVDRFLTTFATQEERDKSASNRMIYWEAGIRATVDHPLGSGGDGFKRIHASKYLADVGLHYRLGRAVHNGFINEACEWGIQGLALRLVLMSFAFVILAKSIRSAATLDDKYSTMMGAAIAAGLAGFLITCLFGDRLDNEWGYWFVALSVAYTQIQPVPETVAGPITDELCAETDIRSPIGIA